MTHVYLCLYCLEPMSKLSILCNHSLGSKNHTTHRAVRGYPKFPANFFKTIPSQMPHQVYCHIPRLIGNPSSRWIRRLLLHIIGPPHDLPLSFCGCKGSRFRNLHVAFVNGKHPSHPESLTAQLALCIQIPCISCSPSSCYRKHRKHKILGEPSPFLCIG